MGNKQSGNRTSNRGHGRPLRLQYRLERATATRFINACRMRRIPPEEYLMTLHYLVLTWCQDMEEMFNMTTYIANIQLGTAQAISDALAGVAIIETQEIDKDGDQVIEIQSNQSEEIERFLQSDSRVHGWIVSE